MLEVEFYEDVKDELLEFAVIISKKKNQFVFCKHRDRKTFEVPGGRREKGENILETAKRELREETGANDFEIEPVCVYSVKGKSTVNKNEKDISFGMLFFADINTLESELYSEIEKVVLFEEIEQVKDWTYPLIQPLLVKEVMRRRGQ